MAGVLKPSGAGTEASYIVNGNTLTQGSSLLDGTLSTSYAYWNADSYYFDVTFNNAVNIWTIGEPAFPERNAKLVVKKWNGSTWDDVTSSISFTRPSTLDGATVWYKAYANIPIGRYRFSKTPGDGVNYANYAMAREWYFEYVAPPILYPLTGQEVISPSISTGGRSGMSGVTVVDSSTSVVDSTITTNMTDGGVLGAGKLWISSVNKKAKTVSVIT